MAVTPVPMVAAPLVTLNFSRLAPRTVIELALLSVGAEAISRTPFPWTIKLADGLFVKTPPIASGAVELVLNRSVPLLVTEPPPEY